jgi:hypothetical protein
MAGKAIVGDTDLWAFLVGGAVCANYLAAKWWHYPFLYCWTAPTARFLWEPVGQYGYLLTLGLFCLYAFKRNWGKDIFNVIIMLMIVNAPVAADTIFRLGGSCG